MAKSNQIPAMSKVIWTNRMDEEFLQAMLREKEKGNRPDGTFTPQAYYNMVQDLNKVFEQPIKKDHLKNRLKTLKDHFAQFYDVFRGAGLSGFSWDPTTKLLGAEDEVWEELIKYKPEAEKWRTKPIKNYEEMMELFSKDRATGAGAETAKDRRKRLEQNNSTAQTIEEIDELLETNDITLESFNMGDEIPETSTQTVTSTQTKLQSTSKNRKRKMDDDDPKNRKKKMEDDDPLASIIIESIKTVADAMDRSAKVLESSRPRVYSEDEIYKELELMEMGSDELTNAYLFLVRHPEDARALFGCPLRMRMTLLGKLMGPQE